MKKTTNIKQKITINNPTTKVWTNDYKQRRKWFFTIWKMDLDWKELCNDYGDIIKYIIVQSEKGEKCGRDHFQGCIHFINPKRMIAIRRLLNLGKGKNSGDLRPQLGTNEQVRSYCTKVKTSTGFKFEYGKPSEQGFRTDLEEIKRRIERGDDWSEIQGDFFGDFIRYRQGFKEYRANYLKRKARKYRDIKVNILSGPTGCGKSRKALEYDENNEMSKDCYLLNAANGLRWFDDYNGETHLIIDEFKNNVQLTHMLGLLQGHFCPIEYKGGTTYALWTKITITTNLKREEIYPNQLKHLRDPFFRRVTNFDDYYPKEEIEKTDEKESDDVILGNTETKITNPNSGENFICKKMISKLPWEMDLSEKVSRIRKRNQGYKCKLIKSRNESMLTVDPCEQLFTDSDEFNENEEFDKYRRSLQKVYDCKNMEDY